MIIIERTGYYYTWLLSTLLTLTRLHDLSDIDDHLYLKTYQE